MRNPSTLTHPDDYVSSSFKCTRYPYDVGERAHSDQVRITEPLHKLFNSGMTRESMLRISNYNQLSADDVDFYTVVVQLDMLMCGIRSDSDEKNMTTDEPIVRVAEPSAVVASDIYQLCVDALIDDASVSSYNSSTDHLPVHGSTSTSTASPSYKSTTQSTSNHFIGVYSTPSTLEFIPRLGRYAHQTNIRYVFWKSQNF